MGTIEAMRCDLTPNLWLGSKLPPPLALPARAAAQLVEASASALRALSWVLDVHLRRDPRLIAEILGLSNQEDWVALLLNSGRFDAGIHRCDVVMQGGEPKILECNVGNAGGWMLAAKLNMYRAPNAGASHSTGWQTVDTVGALMEYLLSELSRKTSDEDSPRLIGLIVDRACTESEFDDLLLAHCRSQLRLAMVNAGSPSNVEIDYVDWSNLQCTRDVRRDGRRIDLIVELDIVPSPQRLLVTELAAEKQVKFMAGPFARIANDKRLLCVLSAWLRRGNDIPGVNADLLRRTLPRTRILRKNALHDMECEKEELRRKRPELVLKKAVSDGGTDVYVGATMDIAIWNQVVDLAVEEEGWIVQDWMEPDLEWGLGSLYPMHVVWGPFFIRGQFSGGFGRLLSLDGYAPSKDTIGSEANRCAVAASSNSDTRIDVLPFYWPEGCSLNTCLPKT